MTIHLESEIVASAYDEATHVCSYTIERNGKRWTVKVPIEHLNAHGTGKGHKVQRRLHLARLLEQAMNGPHDT